MHTEPHNDGRIELRSYFARHRNALVARAQFAPLYTDMYLHFMQHGLKPDPAHAAMLKDALAALALHLVSRPWKESFAWTINFQNPLLNLFATGNCTEERIAGRVFTDGVKERAHGIFWSEVAVPGEPPRRSAVEFDGGDVLAVAEAFYGQSEQRPARFFRYAEEDLVLVAAQPDCDLEWLAGLDDEAIRRLDQDEELSLLEQRYLRFDCGCDLAKILAAVGPAIGNDLEGVFANDDHIAITCPRCGARFEVTRDDIRRAAGSR